MSEQDKSLSVAEASQLRILDPKKLRFFMAGVTLRVTLEGERTCLKTAVVRAFPLSHPGRYFSVRDSAGDELGLLVNPDDLDPDSRKLVLAELERRYMISRLKRIRGVVERFGTVEWDVVTDRGACKFTTRDLRNNVIRIGPGRNIPVDVEDNRYEVEDMYALDLQSQSLLMRHL